MLPSTLAEALLNHLGVAPLSVRRTSGGCINEAAEFVAGGTRYFVKWNSDCPAGMFTAEAGGLRLLREAAAVRIPEVIHFAEREGDRPAYLLLSHFGSAPPMAR